MSILSAPTAVPTSCRLLPFGIRGGMVSPYDTYKRNDTKCQIDPHFGLGGHTNIFGRRWRGFLGVGERWRRGKTGRALIVWCGIIFACRGKDFLSIVVRVGSMISGFHVARTVPRSFACLVRRSRARGGRAAEAARFPWRFSGSVSHGIVLESVGVILQYIVRVLHLFKPLCRIHGLV